MKPLDKIAEVLIAIGNDMKNRLIASQPTAAGQVLVSKLVNGQVVAVWDDVANLGLTGGGTPVTNQLVFSELQNCTYENDTLTYTSGDLAVFGSAGYQAITDKPTSVEFTTVSSDMYLYIGEHTTALDVDNVGNYADGVTEGIFIEMANQGVGIHYGNPTSHESWRYTVGDKMRLILDGGKATVTNVNTGQTWTSPQSDYLVTPKYMGVVVTGTDPLTIKAI